MEWFSKTYKETLKKISQVYRGVEEKVVRAKDKKGQYVADDKDTPDVNEAYTTVEVKKKKGRPTKK
jgi:hypothetical protein